MTGYGSAVPAQHSALSTRHYVFSAPPLPLPLGPRSGASPGPVGRRRAGAVGDGVPAGAATGPAGGPAGDGDGAALPAPGRAGRR
ncbi:hypothetical protein DP116_28440, partial [Brasilonema bromeliae SPC951]|nr:hypothetical protein [Brasilonema bromeliae SPC951]